MTSQKSMQMIDYRAYKSGGWMFSPGLTWMGTRLKNSTDTLLHSNDTSLTARFDPGGRLGVYLEFGRFHIMYEGGTVINYIDYSLAFKTLRGKEKYESDIAIGNASAPYISGKSKFGHMYALANFNFNNVIQYSSYSFIQNSLGFNLDYNFRDKHKNIAPSPFFSQEDPSRLTAQIHYKLGWGYKASKTLFIIPQIETPIFNILDFTNFHPSWTIFNSKYQPIIVSVRFAWLQKQKAAYSCPKPGKKKKKKSSQGDQQSKAQERYNNR